MKRLWFCILLVICGLVLYWVLVFFGLITTSGQVSADDDQKVVYLCSETKAVVVAEPQPTPALNPDTGRRTLLRALYCEECQKWRAIPPSESFGGHPRGFRCPRHRTPLSPKGPIDNR